MHKYRGFLVVVSAVLMCTGADAASTVRKLGAGGVVATPARTVTGATSIGRKASLPIATRVAPKSAVVVPTSVGGTSDANRLSVIPAYSGMNSQDKSGSAGSYGGGSGTCSSCGNIDELSRRVNTLEDNQPLTAYTTWGENDNIDVTTSTKLTTTEYVTGAHADLDDRKQDKLTIPAGSGAFVTGITANDGNVTVTTGEITIPQGDANGPDSTKPRLNIWFE